MSLALRIAYYAAVALADEARTLPALDAYDRLTARNGVQAARLELDEDNFLKAAIAVDAEDEGRWADRPALPAVVEFEAPVAPRCATPIARRVACYSLAALPPDAPAGAGVVTADELFGYALDHLDVRHVGEARRVENALRLAEAPVARTTVREWAVSL